ncbi:MAG: pilus assembly protein [Actinobacteria bacterium]|nr:pilus assembly protein [Actinomycetota bacterium]
MGERGSAVVEFALVVPLVVLVLLAAVEVAVAARTQLEVSQAAREGAREAAASPDPSRAVEVVRSFLGADLAARATVSVRRDHRVGGRAEVTVRLTHPLGGGLLGGLAVTLEGRSSMRVER